MIDAVDVDVHERERGVVLPHDGEARAHDGLGDPERVRDALGEHRLARAELTRQHDDVAGAHDRAEARRERARLGRGMGDGDELHRVRLARRFIAHRRRGRAHA